jgi:hypothetical protein
MSVSTDASNIICRFWEELEKQIRSSAQAEEEVYKPQGILSRQMFVVMTLMLQKINQYYAIKAKFLTTIS